MLILPTGFTGATQFREGARAKSAEMATGGTSADPSKSPDPSLFTHKYADQIVYMSYWPDNRGGGVDTPTALFKARHAVPGVLNSNLRLDTNAVEQYVEDLRGGALPGGFNDIDPVAVVVLFNTADGRNNTLLPHHGNNRFGIVKLRVNSQPRTAAHELAHAVMGWFDEYVESALQGIGLHADDFDLWLTFALSFPDQNMARAKDFYSSSAGAPPYPFSLIDMFGAGSENVSRRECPAMVGPDAALCPYSEEGAFFEFGVFREPGDTLMNHSTNTNHSESQLRTVRAAFEGSIERTNDRIRPVGPVTVLSKQEAQAEGFSKLLLLGFDEDKHHRWHPTREYHFEYLRTGDTDPTRVRVDARPYFVDVWQPDANGNPTNPLVMLIDAIAGGALTATLPARIPAAYVTFELPWRVDSEFVLWRFRTSNAPTCKLACEDMSANNCRGCSEWTFWNTTFVAP